MASQNFEEMDDQMRIASGDNRGRLTACATTSMVTVEAQSLYNRTNAKSPEKHPTNSNPATQQPSNPAFRLQHSPFVIPHSPLNPSPPE
jgi:hypothetical protein